MPACLAMQNQSDTINFQKTFVYLQAKNQLHPHAFLEILQRYANLFWVLWACLITHTQSDSINL